MPRRISTCSTPRPSVSVTLAASMTILGLVMEGESFPMSLRAAYGVLWRFVHAFGLAVFFSMAAPASAAPRDVHVLAFGDSLTAGYGLPRGQGFAPQLEDALRRNGIRAFVTDGGVSGDT